MQTNIAGVSGKVNYFEADLILANHRITTPACVAPCSPLLYTFAPPKFTDDVTENHGRDGR